MTEDIASPALTDYTLRCVIGERDLSCGACLSRNLSCDSAVRIQLLRAIRLQDGDLLSGFKDVCAGRDSSEVKIRSYRLAARSIVTDIERLLTRARSQLKEFEESGVKGELGFGPPGQRASLQVDDGQIERVVETGEDPVSFIRSECAELHWEIRYFTGERLERRLKETFRLRSTMLEYARAQFGNQLDSPSPESQPRAVRGLMSEDHGAARKAAVSDIVSLQ